MREGLASGAFTTSISSPGTAPFSVAAAVVWGPVSSSSVFLGIVPRPWVDESVEHIHKEVRHQHRHCDYEEDSLHEREVLIADRGDEQLADAGVTEHLFHNNRTRNDEC